MKQVFFILTLMLLGATINAGNLEALLGQEISFEKTEVMTTVDYTLITMQDGTSLKVKSMAYAPDSGFLSYDQFMMIYNTTIGEFVSALLADIGYFEEDYSLKKTSFFEGIPDLQFKCIMSKEGMEFEMMAGGKPEVATMNWDEMMSWDDGISYALIYYNTHSN